MLRLNKCLLRTAVVFSVIVLLLGCHAVRPALGRGESAGKTEDTRLAKPASSDTIAEAIVQNAALSPESENCVVLLLSFAWMDGPAEDILRSFVYSARQQLPPYSADVVISGSPLDAVLACDSLMQRQNVRLVVFAGDEGTAISVALLSAEHKVPVLKLTSDSRALTSLSPYLFELLPSGVKQAEELGIFAVRDLHLADLMVLNPQDVRGTLLEAGFRKGASRAGGNVLESKKYHSETNNIRPDLAAIFSADGRIASGRKPLQAALTPEERATAFGDSQSGEVLFTGRDDDSTITVELSGEGLLAVVSPDKVDAYAGQMNLIPKGTTLLGNSSWINLRNSVSASITVDGIYITVPILPEILEKDAAVLGYEAETGMSVNEWELLGLDAGEFVGKVLANPRGRQDIAKAIPQMPVFNGRAVDVDFGGSHENRRVKVLQFKNGEFVSVR